MCVVPPGALPVTACLMKSCKYGARQIAGFTYVGMLLLVALFGLGSAGAAGVLASAERLEKERELLFVGAQFRAAIGSYYQAVPGAARYPPTLSELLQDPRFPTIRRHLRKVFNDPVTGTAQWGLIMAPGGGVMGVHSLSTRTPMKQTGFDGANQTFNILGPATGSERYAYNNWQFVYLPPPGAARR